MQEPTLKSSPDHKWEEKTTKEREVGKLPKQTLAGKTRQYIGSPAGQGKAKKTPPILDIPIRRQVLTRYGDLTEKEIVLTRRLGSGLGSVVYKGRCNGKEVVEKFTASLPLESRIKGLSKKIMEAVSFLFRQASASYRTNFYAAMANHYASLIIADASEFEFGESIVPCLEYTSYDAESGGYVTAYEYVEGRPIRFGSEEHLLKEKLKEWKNFIADKLGLWGIARQCDARNINSPSNVFIVDENTNKMKLVDVTPAVMGGQIWLLPLELEYFFKGLATGNFLPFGDAVDIKRLYEYRRKVLDKTLRLSEIFGKERILKFKDNCESFKFYLNKWRNSEPVILRSPFRVLELIFNIETMKSIIITAITNFEYSGVINAKTASFLRAQTETTDRRLKLRFLQTKLFIRFILYFAYSLPINFYKIVKFALIDLFLSVVKSIG
ncbi:MAG: hypothetical protein JSW40_02880, partial [Candidatus Omnitrophota bacterium]